MSSAAVKRSPQAQVVVVEDEPHLARGICDNLRLEGYHVRWVADGRQVASCLAQRPADLVVLDIMLPGLDGLSVCQQMRQQGHLCPVLFLTAKNAPHERVRGLAVGGDDYLGKPFELEELLGRVAALLRRQGWSRHPGVGPAATEHVQLCGTNFDFRRYQASYTDGRVEEVPARELDILRLLVARRGDVVSREDILDQVWGHDVMPSSRTVDNFIVRLRRRFEPDPAYPVLLFTVRGVGYRLAPAKETL